MRNFAYSKVTRFVLAWIGWFCSSVLWPLNVLSQDFPDAGRILDSIQQPQIPKFLKPAPEVEPKPQVEPEITPLPDTKISVSQFHIRGATVFSENELKALLDSLVNRELTLGDLRGAAKTITDFYRKNGYFVARAYIPAQDIKDGIVEIRILEGKLGKVGISLRMDKSFSSAALSQSDGRKIIAAAIKPGDVLQQKNVERGLLLLNDTPGVRVQSTLQPGASPGVSDLMVEMAAGPLVDGFIDFDNFGNRFSGRERIGALVNLNSPTGMGDLFSIRGVRSQGLMYGRAFYQVPLGFQGTRIGASFSALKYDLCCDFAPLEAEGSANIWGLAGVHPFIRSREQNLYGTLNLEKKNLKSETIAGVLSDKRLKSMAAGLSFDKRDNVWGGGANRAVLGLTLGKLDLGRIPQDLQADQITAMANGHYSKLTFDMSRLQFIAPGWSAYVSLRGQMASKNLDSSEKFDVGGAQGVRAYPQGEASSDEGLLLTAELRKTLPFQTPLGVPELSLFLDTARVRLHRNEWAGWQGSNSNLENTYSLSGLGVGLNIGKPGNYQFTASIAGKLGNNPGSDPSGKDSDGTDDSFRFWLQFAKWFEVGDFAR